MAIREDLVSSAVTFLQDPSVASAPFEKKLAFLQSKNLTQEEIDSALARLGTGSQDGYQAQSPQQSMALATRQQPQYPYGGQYPPPPPGYWGQPPPPEVPRRDWRDYFIMATVMSGLGYGAYFLIKRYVTPLIAPPTPPQLEQDKASVDASFERAFALIDQLTADTASIKASEEARKEKLDSALTDMEVAITELKASSRRRDDDSTRIGEEVRNLQSMIPKAMKGQEEAVETRLKELNAELKSLKTLISNRVTTPLTNSSPTASPTVSSARPNGVPAHDPAADSARVDMTAPPGLAAPVNGSAPTSRGASPNPLGAGGSSTSASQLGKYGAAKGGIPAWQKAAAKKADEARETAATSESGTVTEVENA